MPGAARVEDPIAHTQALAGFLAGALVGVAAAATAAVAIGAVATAAAAEIASGGLATPLIAGAAVTAGEFVANMVVGGSLMSLGEELGEKFGSAMMGSPTGTIISGSPNVFVNGRPAARVLDPVACAAHGDPDMIAQGSTGVFINGLPAARIGDKIVCGGVIIGGSSNVIIGGGKVTKAPIKSEISPWARRAALILSIAPGGLGLARALGPALRGIAEDGFLATAKAGVGSLGRAMEERAGGARISGGGEPTPPPETTATTPKPFSDEPEVPAGAKVSIEDFKPHRPDGLDVERMDIDELPPEDAAIAKQLRSAGWKTDTQKQILNSGADFRSADYQEGDSMYGFSSEGWPKGADSPYWMDEPTFQEMQTRFQDPATGAWDSPGIKNHLALPCYNQANAVYRGQLTETQSVVISTINPATENVIYKSADGTELLNFRRSMTGGGSQFAPALNTVGNIVEHGVP